VPALAPSVRPRFASSSRRVARSLLPASLFLFALCALAQEAAIPPPPRAWLTDAAGVLSNETRQRLDARLQDYERRTGHQFVVWIGETTAGIPLDEFATRTFEAWRPGRKGLDDGLLMIVLARDRKIAIEVGYGLEDRVPDAVAARVIREIMAPRLQAGDPDGAVTAGVEALIAAIGDAPPGKAEPSSERARWSVGKLVLAGLLLVGFLILLATNPSLALSLLYVVMSGRGGYGGGRGGGGGIFSGGGGRSGGGGARGGW